MLVLKLAFGKHIDLVLPGETIAVAYADIQGRNQRVIAVCQVFPVKPGIHPP